MDRDRQRGILTVEAGIILMIFIAEYIIPNRQCGTECTGDCFDLRNFNYHRIK